MTTRMRDALAIDSRMTPEQVLHWLIEFGSAWVDNRVLVGTWADHELFWQGCVRNGWLEHNYIPVDESGAHDYYRLTPKALALVKEADRE